MDGLQIIDPTGTNLPVSCSHIGLRPEGVSGWRCTRCGVLISITYRAA